ncbi:unnamed protein product [Pedinophyceae sp. YPF-701]|nr:unnamed protein product [Pedinophyceae sp. YPF-701]
MRYPEPRSFALEDVSDGEDQYMQKQSPAETPSRDSSPMSHWKAPGSAMQSSSAGTQDNAGSPVRARSAGRLGIHTAPLQPPPPTGFPDLARGLAHVSGGSPGNTLPAGRARPLPRGFPTDVKGLTQWQAGIEGSLKKVEDDHVEMSEHLQQYRSVMPRLTQIALAEWHQHAEAAAEELRVACRSVTEIARHHHRRLVEQATHWQEWQSQVTASSSAVASLAAEAAAAEIAYSAAHIGARYAQRAKTEAVRALRAEHSNTALQLQQAKATLAAAQAEYDKCLTIASHQRQKVKETDQAVQRAQARERELTRFRDTLYELSEAYTAWGRMREPLTMSTLRLAAVDKSVKELIDPESGVESGSESARGKASARSAKAAQQVATDRQALEAQLASLQSEVEKIATTLQELVQRLEEQVGSMQAAGISRAQEWLDALPLPEMLSEVQAGADAASKAEDASERESATGRSGRNQDPAGVRGSCDSLASHVNSRLRKVRLEISSLEIDVVRATAMTGTAEAVSAAIERRRKAAEAQVSLLQASLETDGERENDILEVDRAALEVEAQARQQADEASEAWEELRQEVLDRYKAAREDIAGSVVGVAYLRELLDTRWRQLKEASAQYQGIRDAFWARMREVVEEAGGGVGSRRGGTVGSSSTLAKVGSVDSHSSKSPSTRAAAHSRKGSGVGSSPGRGTSPVPGPLGASMFKQPDTLVDGGELEVRQAAVRIQAAFRGHRARREYAEAKAAAQTIQGRWRTKLATRELERTKSSVTKIQAAFRGNQARKTYAAMRAEAEAERLRAEEEARNAAAAAAAAAAAEEAARVAKEAAAAAEAAEAAAKAAPLGAPNLSESMREKLRINLSPVLAKQEAAAARAKAGKGAAKPAPAKVPSTKLPARVPSSKGGVGKAPSRGPSYAKKFEQGGGSARNSSAGGSERGVFGPLAGAGDRPLAEAPGGVEEPEESSGSVASGGAGAVAAQADENVSAVGSSTKDAAKRPPGGVPASPPAAKPEGRPKAGAAARTTPPKAAPEKQDLETLMRDPYGAGSRPARGIAGMVKAKAPAAKPQAKRPTSTPGKAKPRASAAGAPPAKSPRGNIVRIPQRSGPGLAVPNDDLGAAQALLEEMQAGRPCHLREINVNMNVARRGPAGNAGAAQAVHLCISRDFSRLAYKATGAKVSSFIRVVDVAELEERALARTGGASGRDGALTPNAERQVVIRLKGSKEFRITMNNTEDKELLVDCMVILMANKQFLASLKATLDGHAAAQAGK